MPFVRQNGYWILTAADKAQANEVARVFDDNFIQLPIDLSAIRTVAEAAQARSEQNESDVTSLDGRMTIAEQDIQDLKGRGDRTGWVRITDVTAQDPLDAVAQKLFQDAPNNTIFESGESSSASINVHVESSYPLVTVNGQQAVLAKNDGIYSGVVAVDALTSEIVLEATDSNGALAARSTAEITVNLPPVITDAVFTGDLPGIQTELKQGDTFALQVTADSDFDQVLVADYGAAQAQVINVPVGTSATVTITIADRGDTLQNLPARVSVRASSTGALSQSADTDDFGSTLLTYLLPLNNLHPSISIGAVTYPGSQQALKDTETASVSNSVSDYDLISYTSPNGDLAITDASTFAADKTVQRQQGTYNVTEANFRITATRAANGAESSAQTVVQIAHVAVVVTVSEPAARLRSGGNNGTTVQSHPITVSADQQLLNAPTLNPDSGGSRGAFSGSWTGGPSVWTRDLQVHDNDEKGTFAWEGLVATNLAGIVTNAISGDSQYTLGGFVARDVTFAAFADQAQINVAVTDFSKLTAGIFTATNQQSQKQPIGTVPSVTNGYTIDAVSTNPTTVTWLDTSAVESNSSGTAQLLSIEETV